MVEAKFRATSSGPRMPLRGKAPDASVTPSVDLVLVRVQREPLDVGTAAEEAGGHDAEDQRLIGLGVLSHNLLVGAGGHARELRPAVRPEVVSGLQILHAAPEHLGLSRLVRVHGSQSADGFVDEVRGGCTRVGLGALSQRVVDLPVGVGRVNAEGSYMCGFDRSGNAWLDNNSTGGKYMQCVRTTAEMHVTLGLNSTYFF